MSNGKFRAVGTDDAVNSCDCCGRKDLKYTVIMLNDETGDVVHFGSTCAVRNSGKAQKFLTAEIDQNQRAAQAELDRSEEKAALEAARERARAQRIPLGKPFLAATQPELDAYNARGKEIAERYHVRAVL